MAAGQSAGARWRLLFSVWESDLENAGGADVVTEAAQALAAWALQRLPVGAEFGRRSLFALRGTVVYPSDELFHMVGEILPEPPTPHVSPHALVEWLVSQSGGAGGQGIGFDGGVVVPGTRLPVGCSLPTAVRRGHRSRGTVRPHRTRRLRLPPPWRAIGVSGRDPFSARLRLG